MLKELLKVIEDEGRPISRREIAGRLGTEYRYVQGALDTLSEIGHVSVEKRGTLKLHVLTEEGRRFLRKLER